MTSFSLEKLSTILWRQHFKTGKGDTNYHKILYLVYGQRLMKKQPQTSNTLSLSLSFTLILILFCSLMTFLYLRDYKTISLKTSFYNSNFKILILNRLFVYGTTNLIYLNWAFLPLFCRAFGFNQPEIKWFRRIEQKNRFSVVPTWSSFARFESDEKKAVVTFVTKSNKRAVCFLGRLQSNKARPPKKSKK